MKKSLVMMMLIGMLLCACASSGPYRLKPIDPVQRWESGQAVVECRDKGLVAAVSFEHEYNGELFFDVELTNTSDKALIVSPKKFYYDATMVVDKVPVSKRVFAIDPEKKILEIDKLINNEVNEQDNDQAVDFVFSIVDCAIDIVEIVDRKNKKSQEQLDQEQHEEEQRESDYETRMAAYDARISDLKQERQTWMQQTIRKTTLAAHQSLKGKVIFPLAERPDTITLLMPVGDSIVSLAFQREDS